jgi:dipeptide/tripeptide permease
LPPKIVHFPLVGDHTLTAYRTVFLVGTVLAVVAFVLTLFLRNDIDAEREADPSAPVVATQVEPPWRVAVEVVREKAFWRFMILIALLVIVKMVFQHGHFTLPKYALRELGESFPIGRIQAINPICVIVLVPIVTALTRHLGMFRVMLVGCTISAASVFVLVLPASFATIAVFYVLLSIGEALWSPRSYEFIATIAPRGRESSYMGLSGLPFFVAKLGALPMSGWLLTHYCPPQGPRQSWIMWLVIGLMTATGPILMFALRSVIQGPKASPTPVEPAVATPVTSE